MHLYVNDLLKNHVGNNRGNNCGNNRGNNGSANPNSSTNRSPDGKTNCNSYCNLLDLYGGVGTFGIINSDLFKTVKTVESFEGCVDAAKANIELNGVKNTEAILLDAMHLKKLDLQSPLFVITDPPRSGMHQKTIEQLIVLKPKLIIYISCSIQQLEKELPKFLKHYKLKSAAIFDLFPQTNHMETVVELVRS